MDVFEDTVLRTLFKALRLKCLLIAKVQKIVF